MANGNKGQPAMGAASGGKTAESNKDAVKQNLPTGQVSQSAPAAPAAKAKAPKIELTDEQKKLKAAMDEAKAKFNAAVGKVAKARKGGTGRAAGTGGLSGDLLVTVVPGTSYFEKDNAKLATAIGDKGIKLSELVAKDGADWNWVRYRLVRGALRLNGKTFAEAFNPVPAQAA